MAGSASRSFRLLGASWRLLGRDPRLLVLPLGALLTSGAVVAVFVVTGLLAPGGPHPALAFYLALYVLYAIIAFISICFNATLVAVALLRLNGVDATIGDGWTLVRGRIGAVIRWALLAATVGVVLRAVQERTGVFGLIAGWVGSIAWGLVTFFVVPVLLFEPTDVRGAIRRSAGIFRRRWGEAITGNLTIGLGFAAVALPFMIAGTLLLFVSIWLGTAVLVATFLTLLVLTSAMTDVFTAALYRYAIDGSVPRGFTPEDFESAIKHRRSGRSGRRSAVPPRPDPSV